MNGEEDLNRKEMYKVVTSENREARLMKKLEKIIGLLVALRVPLRYSHKQNCRHKCVPSFSYMHCWLKVFLCIIVSL